MKFSSNQNGHTAANSLVGTSYTDTTSTPEKSDVRPQGPQSVSPATEEQAFRKFLLSRLPEVKAPESLKQKIKSSIKNFRP